MGSRRVARFALGATRLIVASAPLVRDTGLTPAEAAVAWLAADGLSDAEIAARRRTSPRTVANQLRAILRKLGAGSRRELAARLVVPRGSGDAR